MQTQEAAPAHIHPPKIEYFDLDAKSNTDPKGHLRGVEEYRTSPHGLYMFRPVPGHPRLSHFESWLLPSQGLRVTRQSWHPGHEQDYDLYVDVVEITSSGTVWKTIDLYLDLIVRTGRSVTVLDTDELLAALAAGLVQAPRAQWALETTYRAVAGISAHGFDAVRWLASQGVVTTWRRR
jgi:predicted RNA-binding protein associated with RNAse of E/G family